MALANFPQTPAAGDKYSNPDNGQEYVYDATDDSWSLSSAAGASSGGGGGDNFLDYGTSGNYTSPDNTTTTHTTGDTTWTTTGNVISVGWQWQQPSVQYIGGAGGLRQARLRISLDGGTNWTVLDDYSQSIGGSAQNIGWSRNGTTEIPGTAGTQTVRFDILVNNGDIDSGAGSRSTQSIGPVRISDNNVTITTGVY